MGREEREREREEREQKKKKKKKAVNGEMVNFIPFGSRNRWGQLLFAMGLGAFSGYFIWKEPLEKYFEEQEVVRNAREGDKEF